MSRRNKDFVDLKNIEAEYLKHEAMAVWIATQIRMAMSTHIPPHITEEIINQAKYSLIVSLNTYNKHFENNKLRKIKLKNYIIYHLYDDINRWWLSTYVGCKSIKTQKKHRLYPQSLNDMLKEDQNNPLLKEPVYSSTPLDDLIKQDDLQQIKEFIRNIKKRLRIPQYQLDTIMYSYTDYNIKYPNKMTCKCHDNTRQLLIKRIKEIV